MAALQRLALRGTPKATKQAARYTPAGGAERCGMCRHYVPSSSCARIEGPVSAAGWCQLYSQQVTWRPRAGQDAGFNPGLVPPGVTLDLSFLSAGTLDPRITFTRASTATYFDATGTMKPATANAPRWDYDPVTHALRGLLIEEARTNVWLYSADPTNAAWTKGQAGSVAPVVTGNQIAAPDGTVTGCRAVFPALTVVGNFTLLYQSFTLTAVPYTLSVWLKGNAGGEQLYLGISNSAATVFYSTPVTLTTQWQRFALTTPALTAGLWFVDIGTDRRDPAQAATSAQTIYVWGAQLEQGAFPTSYIPTTAAAVTRSADLCSIPTSPWYNFNFVSLLFEIYNPVQPSGALGGFGDNTNFPNSLYLSTGTTFNRGGISSASSGPLIVGAVNKTCGTLTTSTIQCCTNAGVIGSVANAGGAAGAVTLLALGGAAWFLDGTMNGHMRRARYWPRVLTNAEMRSVTT